jgi:hypothetical protein
MIASGEHQGRPGRRSRCARTSRRQRTACADVLGRQALRRDDPPFALAPAAGWKVASVARLTNSAMDTLRPSLSVSSAAVRTSPEYSSSSKRTLTARFFEDNFTLPL